MLSSLGFALLLCTLGSAMAREPQPCCPPKQFIIRIDEVTTSVENGTIITEEVRVQKAYDATNELMTDILYEYDPETGTSEQMKTIYLFPKGAKYVIKNGKCTKEPLLHQFLELCVPAVATYYGKASVGLEEFSADYFFLTLPLQSYHLRYQFGFGREKCIPYQFSVQKRAGSLERQEPSVGDGPLPLTSPFDRLRFNDGADGPISVRAQYFDYMEGIDDPSYWFKLPPECQQPSPGKEQRASAKKMADSLFRSDQKFVVY